MTYPGYTLRTEKGVHRLHAIMETLTFSLACVQTAVTFRGGGKTDWADGDYMSYECAVFDAEVRLPLGSVIETIIAGIPVNSIELGVCEKSWNYRKAENGTKIIKNTISWHVSILKPFFVEFYENYIEYLRFNLKSDHTKWPTVWQFGRVIRNASAHNKICIDDQNFAPVSWHKLTYGPNENGKEIFGHDLEIGDLIILMCEMSDELDRLNVPLA